MKSKLHLILSLLVLAMPATGKDKIESCVAIKPPAAESGGQRIWGEYFWPQNSTLRVKFMDGTKSQQTEAFKRFQVIDKLTNLTFERVESGHSDIRVAFNPNAGHWSYVGTGNRSVSRFKPTMNLALKAGIFGDSRVEWDRVAIHEVCHAIGMNHEHQHPQASIKWNVPAVLDYYRRTQGWTDAEIKYQVLNRSPMTRRFRGTAFDPDSIMEYPVDPSLTLDGFSVGWNIKLSPLDIMFLGTIYPNKK